ncbi:TylF/MycF family methyltransferase [Isoptericola sp. NEAU-Y5]|uniref:TylF/MycF family methyltransferase n=1 Tax=Isoptericola luteus TaxID=2879484 RepID=A0ABS7ZCI0_9MICO|nr:TylF/MycF/NovP-related O-methyltransferase [Isoptericola sp. NEAU-Y5]MCA5892748.1 TylF/MycF family methyltransferase [Isoptericola sp. NEAU-Y5]
MQRRSVRETIDAVRRRAASALGGRVELDAARAELSAARAELDRRTHEVRRLRRRVRELEVTLLDDLPDSVSSVAHAVRTEHLTLLGARPLAELAQAVLDVEAQGVGGLMLECGTARGGSAIVMAAAKSPERLLSVHDVFGLIPPPTDEDGEDVHARYAKITAGEARGRGGEEYYGYRGDLYTEVHDSFARHGLPVETSGVRLVRGLFEDTVTGDEPVALAHLDGDWYASTRTCLERVAPRLVPGGRLVIDDYFAWSGCRKAVDEYLAEHDGLTREMHSRLHLVRR